MVDLKQLHAAVHTAILVLSVLLAALAGVNKYLDSLPDA